MKQTRGHASRSGWTFVLTGLVAAGVALTAATTASAQFYDHQKCYKFKDAKMFRSVEADIDSLRVEFGLENCDIKAKGKLYCVPADKSVTEIVDGTDTPFAADELAFDRICYKIKCPNVTHPPMTVSDQFGTRAGEKFKASMLCTPAVLGIPTTTTTSTSTTTTSTVTTTTVVAPATFSFKFGDTGDDSGVGVALDSVGNVFVGGTFEGTVDFGTGPIASNGGGDAVVVKYDPAGNVKWAVTFGDTGDDSVIDVKVDSLDNVLLTGTVSGTVSVAGGPSLVGAGGEDVLVAKLSNAGAHVWSAVYGDVSDQSVIALAVNSADGVAIAGVFEGNLNFGGGAHVSAGNEDAFVAQFTSTGVFGWSSAFGDVDDDRAQGIAVDSGDNVIVGGAFEGSVNFGGGAIVSAGGSDAFAVKLTSGGSHVWSQGYGDASSQSGFTVAVDSSDNVLVSGFFGGMIDLGGGALSATGTVDMYLAQLTSAGSHVWSQAFGGAAGVTLGLGVGLDGSDNVVLAGFTDAASIDFGGGALAGAGGNDVFVAKLDSSGSYVSSQLFGDASGDSGYRVTTDGAGNRYLTGVFAGSIDFGDGLLTSAGGDDGFVVKLAP